MFSGERPRNKEDVAEVAISPEQVAEQSANNAVGAVEARDATDPVTSSKWATEAKKYGKIAGISLGLSFILIGKILYGVLKFAKKAIEKRGQVGFEEGYKISQEIFETKKDKK